MCETPAHRDDRMHGDARTLRNAPAGGSARVHRPADARRRRIDAAGGG